MKKAILLVILLMPILLFSQKSIVKIKGEIKELCVSPDNSVWLMSNAGIMYWVKDFNSNLEVKLKLPEAELDFFGKRTINIERVSFFNKDTFFVSGYLGNDLTGAKRGETNKIYLTRDGGSSWMKVQFNTSGVWIYDSYATEQGKAWIGGSSGTIFFTSDYGNKWEKLASPFNASSRTSCFFINDQSGIVGALGNKLKISNNGFKSFKKIKTPLDRDMYNNDGGLHQSDNRILKVYATNTNYIVNQQNNVFYSSKEKVDWKSFKPMLIDFAINNDSNQVVGLTKNNEIVIFSDKFIFLRVLADISEDETVTDIKLINNVTYVLAVTYFEPKEGDNEVGTIEGLKIVRVGYKKVSSYNIYIIENGKVIKKKFEVEE